jgi:hypothetical protein
MSNKKLSPFRAVVVIGGKDDVVLVKARNMAKAIEQLAAQGKQVVSIQDGRHPMSDAEYKSHNGMRCPNCGSMDLSGDVVNIDAGGASQEISCLDCGAGWHDAYKLTGYTDLEGV